MLHRPARRNDGVFPLLLWRSPPPKMKSAKIVPATAARSWLFLKISANPLFTLAEKRRFYSPKLPALRAEVDGLAQKSAKPFLLLFRRSVQNPSIFPIPAFLAFAEGDFSCCRARSVPTFFQRSRTEAQRPVFWCLAGTRSAGLRKPHKPPTRARRRGTRCRSQLHLLHLLRFRHFRLRIGGNRVPLTILGFPRSYKLLLQQFFC